MTLPRDCDGDRAVKLTGLAVGGSFVADVVGDKGLKREVEAATSSTVMFCWEKSEEADDE
jgi:hypothetical protein